ncbi:hypothetical protein [Methylobacterium oryzisoli]|uniref:hypothetical protein n=1 Tax=Methylobacterium oryzisoli TaxID=3385502 RepID=UPI0038912DDD
MEADIRVRVIAPPGLPTDGRSDGQRVIPSPVRERGRRSEIAREGPGREPQGPGTLPLPALTWSADAEQSRSPHDTLRSTAAPSRDPHPCPSPAREKGSPRSVLEPDSLRSPHHAPCFTAAPPGPSRGIFDPLPLSRTGKGFPARAGWVCALASPGGPLWTASAAGASLTDALAVLLRGFAESGARRLRDLGEGARADLLAAAGLAPAAAPPPDNPPPPGLHPRPVGGPVLLAEFPFGRCDAARLAALAALAERHGDGRLRLTPWRGAMLVARDAQAAAALAAAARDLDLIVAADDPRRAVAACPGAPACASGGTPAQAHAARLAARLGPRPAGVRVHVSGCPKGCAHPGRADLTLVGRPDGRYGVVHAGHAGDPEAMVLPFEAVLERLNSAGMAALHPDREPA